jgi:beta-glucuronidase
LRIGVRTIEVKGDQLLLNSKPVFLTGFGKHEDFPIHGRGLDVPVIVRDFELLKWVGANSFRTSHYPYSDEAMQLADQYGLLVIAETPAVSLDFVESADVIETRHRQHSQALSELVARDKNHPCVILWSIANEPGLSVAMGTGGDPKPMIERGTKYFQPLFEYARARDGTRPVVLVSVGSGPDEWVGLGDIICTNLYYGWYYGGQGQLQTVAKSALEGEIARLRAKHNKPIMLTEFGADTIAGTHAQPAEMWSEEYQAEMLEMYVRTLRQYPFVVGSHPWAFADFRTSQGIIRAGGINQKGVFTRDRRPKLAAHKLRELWKTNG